MVGLTTESCNWLFAIRFLRPSFAFPTSRFHGKPRFLDPECARVGHLKIGVLVLGKKLYVGNLPYGIQDSDLDALFAQFGNVQSAQIIVDRETNRSKGFGFVEMSSDSEAQAAIDALNERDFNGRNLTVNEARPREPRSGGGGGYGGGGGGGYGGGGRGGYGGNRY